jgi:hypothetical protein
VPFNCYGHFQSAVKKLSLGMEATVENLQRALLHLPKVNINVLKYLVRFLSQVHDHSEENKMNALNLATIFGPNILRPQTADPQLLMECNTTCTDFVCIAITQHQKLFPCTSDEKPPKRLSIVLSVDDLSSCWADGGRLVQRSLYNPQDGSPKHSTSRARRGSAPYPVAPQEDKDFKSGVVASMVQQFNLRTTHSASQISGSHEISSPVEVHHTAGQKPGGATLQNILASKGILSQSDSPVRSGLHVPLNSSEPSETQVATATLSSPQEKRFSGSGNNSFSLSLYVSCG